MMFIGMIILLSFALLFLSFYDKVLPKNFKNQHQSRGRRNQNGV